MSDYMFCWANGWKKGTQFFLLISRILIRPSKLNVHIPIISSQQYFVDKIKYLHPQHYLHCVDPLVCGSTNFRIDQTIYEKYDFQLYIHWHQPWEFQIIHDKDTVVEFINPSSKFLNSMEYLLDWDKLIKINLIRPWQQNIIAK